MKWVLLGSLFLNILFVSVFLIIRTHLSQELTAIWNNIFYKKRPVIMYGDSLTASGKWNTLLNRKDVFNSGIPGGTSSHLVWQLKKMVLDYSPEICFIEGGINDIGAGIPQKRTLDNFKTIIETLKSNNVIPVIQSTIFTQEKAMNPQIESLNLELKKLALTYNIIYLDLNENLSLDNELKKQYSKDGIHLTKVAYPIWADKIIETLNVIEK